MKGLIPFLLCLAFPLLSIAQENGKPQHGLPERLVTVTTASGVAYEFQVQLAATDHSRRFGLMFRESMALNEGMLFDFKSAAPQTFWMKNTPISLDIAFIDTDGRILNIARKTTPYSLNGLPSQGSTRWVLEINGGLSDLLGIASGDQIEIKERAHIPE